jgi:hypothetical protein
VADSDPGAGDDVDEYDMKRIKAEPEVVVGCSYEDDDDDDEEAAGVDEFSGAVAAAGGRDDFNVFETLGDDFGSEDISRSQDGEMTGFVYNCCNGLYSYFHKIVKRIH